MGKSRKTPFFFGKYYEGFTTVEEIDKNGKAYSKRVYVDFYYQAQLDGREKRLHKAVNILFTLLAVLFLAVSMTIRVPSNYYWFTTLPQALGVIPVLWQIYLAGLYVSAEPK